MTLMGGTSELQLNTIGRYFLSFVEKNMKALSGDD